MIKYTLKLILWTHDSNIDNRFPIYLRITIDRERAYLATGKFVAKSQWSDKDEQVKGVKDAVDINAQIQDLKSRVLRRITDSQLENKPITAKQIKQQFSGADMHNIFEFTDLFIKEVKHKREAGTLENYTKHLLKLELYNGGKNLNFEQITPEWLGGYETALRAEELSNNYVHALFKTLKLIFNAAIKKKIITDYPFSRYENPIYTAPVKDYLTLSEIKLIEQFTIETKDPILKQTAVYFLLGISTGLRISDWFQFSIVQHIKDGKVLVRAKKNGEWVTMPINAILKRNIPRMKAVKLSIEEQTINEKLKVIATKLDIKKRITSHTGRHTFAVTLCADRGISSETCAELMGITISTCIENYYKVSQRKIDKETLLSWKGL
ncbi:MAG: site-specific integrase [Chitinophagia bacterium]